MATLYTESSGRRYVIVVKGDNLWNIAKAYLGAGIKYKQIKTINGLKTDLIIPGQKLYLDKSSSGSTPSSGSKTLSITLFGLQADKERTLLAVWDWYEHSNTEEYKLYWTYSTDDKLNGKDIWFLGNDGTTDQLYSTFDIPDNANVVKFKVQAIAKTDKKTQNNKEVDVKRFSDTWSNEKSFNVSDKLPPPAPSKPSVEMKGNSLTAKVTGVDSDTTKIRFYLHDTSQAESKYKTVEVDVKYNEATYTWNGLESGKEYRIRCKGLRSGLESIDFSEYSDAKSTPPNGLDSISSVTALSETSVQLTWSSVDTADTYEIEYTTVKNYFDTNPNGVMSTSRDHPTTTAILTGLTSGEEYFFRLRVKNANGESGWTGIKSIKIGEPPAAPTTWSSTTTAIVGEPLTLFWTHNTEDGSAQTLAEIEFTVDGELIEPSVTVRTPSTGDEEDLERIYSYDIDTSDYPEGTKIEWRVRTMGIIGTYGDWSVKRTIDVYATPSLTLDIIDSKSSSISTIETFPFYIYGLAGPSTQAPTGYHIEIISNDSYQAVDNIGNEININAGDSIYSKYFDTSDPLMVEMSANNLDLENGRSYTVKVTVSMNSGLTVEESVGFQVAWSEVRHIPNAEIGINTNNYSALIRPYCEDVTTTYYLVEKTYSRYKKTDTEIGFIAGEEVSGIVTTTGEKVYTGMTEDGEEVFYCTTTTSELVEGVSLSVYRKEFDGSFTEVVSGLTNTNSTFCIDPHPSLDFARYRIIATDDATGTIGYADLPGIPVLCSSIIIQWDEEWAEFNDPGYEDPLAEPSWTGSFLELPYNVDVSENSSADVAFIEYIGRSHPVSYYGTHLGETALWNTSIPKDDKDTIYALRRLSKWAGDVYVREPSGTGYWANVVVSFSQKHLDLTIPVSFKITRVEGGV